MALITLNPWQTQIRKLRVLTTELELADTHEEVDRLVQAIRVLIRHLEDEFTNDPIN